MSDVRVPEIYARDAGVCHLCLVDVPADAWHLEHVIPLFRGGTHEPDNCAVSCASCNLRKGTRVRSARPAVLDRALAAYARFHGAEYVA